MGGWFPVGYLMAEFTMWILSGLALAAAVGVSGGAVARSPRLALRIGSAAALFGTGAWLFFTVPYDYGGPWSLWIVVGAVLGALLSAIVAAVTCLLKRVVLRKRRRGRVVRTPYRLEP